ncbi:enoyl-CoA hydratase/isomerase family protein [Baekduia soli]|uniref:Enoyl-CoA hydratase/isomerase family protein n=1 Tax=Baekduia soli TaxID=496014 RepID=A0A5B8U7E5_9ACTN|nr:enoyl-CoA hydratase/isomerase family protein [Baekduia soli]QEC48748.1 enoyl-CoA hydratase/isomerase family protein [Baekduia soli]
MTASYEHLVVEQEGPLMRVWLDRPEVLNALNDEILVEITDLFTGLQGTDEIRVVVLGGVGRCFSSGADLRRFPGRTTPDVPLGRRRWRGNTGLRAARAIADADPVTIARTHSHVLGGGVVLAISCDFRIGADDTILRLPEVELGAPLPWGGTPLLIREMGASRAREFVMFSTPLDAAQAREAGLLHAVVPAASLDAEVDAWVQRLLALPEESVAATKQQFRRYAAVTRLADLSETDAELGQRVTDRGA